MPPVRAHPNHPAAATTRLTAAHWGIYEAVGEGQGLQLKAFSADPDPSPIGLGMLDAARGPVRVRKPAVRLSWLQARRQGQVACAPELRGQDPFVELSWPEALDLLADELQRVRQMHGNASIYGGSYGWSSAGRFHHAQSQVHRFLNSIGGYVRHVDTYSLGAARVLMPHIVAPMEELFVQHTSWRVMARHTELFVAFGGVPAKNAQISSGGATEHAVPGGLRRMAEAGVRFINISPVGDDLDTGAPFEWIAIRPGTDTALLLAIGYVLLTEGRIDRAFLSSHCVGFERVEAYLLGQGDGQAKTPEWASVITEVPAQRIVELAREMANSRTMINMAWSLQRAHHGEQPYWALVTVAAMLGQIGLPGGGFGVGYGTTNMIGNDNARFSGPTLPQGRNPVADFIPVARITDMLERPGDSFDYNGQRLSYPDIRLIYWAGGNPFHHHQDLNRLLAAWQSKPETIVVHEQYWTPTARLADIVLPATTALEREDIGYATRERYMVAMRQLIDPVGEARDDYDIFADLAQRLGAHAQFTEGRSSGDWLRLMYEQSRERAATAGVALPSFDGFWQQGLIDLAQPEAKVVMLERFRANPQAHPLGTPSGRIELFSERIAGFGYADCPGHATWFEPIEWLGSEKTRQYPLHLISDQPFTKLHSQLDHADYSQSNKVHGREPIGLSPFDAQQRGLREGDLVRVFNDRGACVAAVRICDRIRPGVVRLSTGAWFQPSQWRASGPANLELHGNPNVLTLDIGSSSLSQGNVAQSCLVQIISESKQENTKLNPYSLPCLE